MVIPYVSEALSLGVIFTSNLSWKSCVLHISQKVHFSLHKLKFHRNIPSQNLRTTLISTLICLLIDYYCCLVYHSLANEQDLTLQQRLLNCGIRFIFDLRRDVHITQFRLQLGWLSVSGRRNYFLGIAMFNITHLTAPSYILEMFRRPSSNCERSRRRLVPTFDIPLHQTEFYRRFFTITGMEVSSSLYQFLADDTYLQGSSLCSSVCWGGLVVAAYDYLVLLVFFFLLLLRLIITVNTSCFFITTILFVMLTIVKPILFNFAFCFFYT